MSACASCAAELAPHQRFCGQCGTALDGALLAPLARARGGAGPLLATLEAYYACGGVAAQAARRLHLSVRAVTYRLARIKELTGSDPGDPAGRHESRQAEIRRIHGQNGQNAIENKV